VVTDAAPYEPESGQGSAADRIGELQRRRGGS